MYLQSRQEHFIDPGDMQDRKTDIPSLLKVRDSNTILSVNENIRDN
jgi:hypothetical protein